MNNPETVRLIPELNIAALNQHKDRELLFWYLLRAINQSGSSRVDLNEAELIFTELFKYSRRTFYRHLIIGSGKLWEKYHSGARRIKIYGLETTLRYLNTFNVSRWRVIDIATLQKYPRKALLWNTGAYRPFGTGRVNNPISRPVLQNVTGITERKQQRYDARVDTFKIPTTVKEYDLETHKLFNQPLVVHGKNKHYVIPRPLGNIYTSHAYQSQKGMLKKASRSARQGRGSLIAGEAPNKEMIPKQRFYGTFRDWLKQYTKGKAQVGNVFYPTRANFSVYVEVLEI